MPSKKLAARQRVEQAVEKAEFIDFDGLKAVLSPTVVNLILAERRRIRRDVLNAIRERGDEYMRDADNPKMKNLAQVNAGRAWAFKDFAEDMLTRLRG